MPITSHLFLLLFLPISAAVYYLLLRNSRQKLFFLLGLSILFYAVAGIKFIPVLLGLSLATYWAGKWKKINWGILLNLAALGLFKYWNFGIENANYVLSALNIEHSLGLLKLGMPLGLSFFVFKHIGYLIDIRQERYEPATDFWLFATFSAYFPQISAGPISNFKETAQQFLKLPEKLPGEMLVSSLIYISFGLAKKILIADTIGSLLASPVNQVAGFAGFVPAWYLVIAYAMQLYFDFSGYTDLTLGISMLFGIKLPQNFNSPYLAASPAEFWERWHMSLSTWFRNYLFFPLSRFYLRKWGSEKRARAQYTANIITMTLVGLWHGAGWNFILWGFFHGLYLNLGAWRKQSDLKIPRGLERGLFLVGILFGWALFMGTSPEYLQHLFKQLLGFGGPGSLELLLDLLNNNATPALLFALPISFSGFAEAANIEQRLQSNRWALAALGAVAAICLLFIETVNSFIYIRF